MKALSSSTYANAEQWMSSNSTEDIVARLSSFIEKAEQSNNSSSSRSGAEDLTFEDAYALLESALHLNFNTDKTKVESFEVEKTTLTLALTNETSFDAAAVEQAFISLKNTIEEKLATEPESKILYLVDVESQATTAQSGQVHVTLIYGKNGLVNPCWPNETDNWFVCCEAGKCNNTNVGMDASEREAQLVNSPACIASCDGTELWLNTRKQWFTYDDSPLGHLRWSKYEAFPLAPLKCLPYGTIGNNVNILKDIINIKRPTSTYFDAYYKFIHIIVEDKQDANEDYPFIVHNGEIYYNQVHCIHEDIIDEH